MTHRFKLIISIICLFIKGAFLQAQSPEQMEALNLHVDFLTESVHGLTVAQIMFINYNQELNKYVDLESIKLNTHINNDQFEMSLFDDPEYTAKKESRTALALSKLSKQKSAVLNRQTKEILNKYVDEIVVVLNKINALRFEIERFIGSFDLNEKENVYIAYELLEKAEAHFLNYFIKHDKLATRLRLELDYEYNPMDFIFYEIYSASVAMLSDLRREQYSKVRSYLSRIEGALSNFSSQNLITSSADKITSSELANQVQAMCNFVRSNLDTKTLPGNYPLYGKYYYLHNQLLLTHFNSISPGFTSKMNLLLESANKKHLKYEDRPIMFKVIYPQKMKEIESIATKKVINSDAYPLNLKLKMEQPYLEMEFYDPNQFDRDSIDVSLNGDLILEDYKLTFLPKKIRLDVDATSGHNLVITAKNAGIIYPNTIGFKYRFSGKGKRHTIEKSLLPGESINLELKSRGAKKPGGY